MVVDEETGMAEMMPDPNQVVAAPAENQEFVAVGDDGTQDNMMVMKGEDSGGNIMVMLPNGEQGMVVAGEDLQNHGLEGLVQGGDKEQMYVVTSAAVENQNCVKEEFTHNGTAGQNFVTNRNSVPKDDHQELFNGFEAPVVVNEPPRSITNSGHNISLGNESSMIRIVGIQDKVVRPQVSVVKVCLDIHP